MREVKPIKDERKVKEIWEGLANYRTEHERRIYLMFTLGICTGLRIGDMLGLRVCQVNYGDRLRLREEKTGKAQDIKIGKRLREVLDAELNGLRDDDFLFPSRQRGKRGEMKHITVGTAENDMKLIAKWFNIKFPFSCHSLRKTFGYRYFQDTNDLEGLARHFNHANTSVTRRYIGLDEDDRNKAIERLWSKEIEGHRTVQAKKRSNQVNDIIIKKHHDRTAQKAAFVKRMQAGKQRKNKQTEGN